MKPSLFIRLILRFRPWQFETAGMRFRGIEIRRFYKEIRGRRYLVRLVEMPPSPFWPYLDAKIEEGRALIDQTLSEAPTNG